MKPFSVLLLLGFALVARAADVPSAEAREQIAELRREISHHDELYHRKATPAISDADYDRLKQRLTELERKFPEAAKASAPVQEPADDRSGLFQTYRHRAPMMSLEKAYAPVELRTFHARLAKALGRDDLEYVIEPKVDGLAVSVTYERGKLVRAVTRGNGVEGDDITANVLLIAGLSPELRPVAGNSPPESVELRGEIYVPFAEFERVNAEREMAGEPRFANPRNLAAGTIRQLDTREIAARGLRIVFFGIGACEPSNVLPATQRDLRETFKRWGLPAIADSSSARGGEELATAIDALGRARAGLPFPTDGAVVKLDSMAQQRVVGASETAPRWALAFKFAPERMETQVRAIALQVGRTGVLTPVAELVPIQLAGSKVSRATLHNREEIARKDVRVGDFVYVEKAGEVIPAVVGVNLARRTSTVQPFQFPVGCPECYVPLVQSEAEVAVKCPNHACPAQVRRRIEHFASKACLDIEGLGPTMIETLVDHGWAKEAPDLYRLRRADLLSLGKNNEKSVDRLLAAIEKSKRAELWRVIHGLGIPQVGAATARDLARQCGSLAALAENGPKAAAVLAESRYQALIADLITVGVGSEVTASNATRLAGMTFVLTGTLPNFTRAQATARIEAVGGKVIGAVSRTTHYVVAGAEPGVKLVQAREFGVTVLDETGLMRLLSDE